VDFASNVQERNGEVVGYGVLNLRGISRDVRIKAGPETVTLLQGQSITRDDSSTSMDSNSGNRQDNNKGDSGAAPTAHKAALNSSVWIDVGVVAGLGGLAYVLTRSGHPVSPVLP
jgi:hypothetical protein